MTSDSLASGTYGGGAVVVAGAARVVAPASGAGASNGRASAVVTSNTGASNAGASNAGGSNAGASTTDGAAKAWTGSGAAECGSSSKKAAGAAGAFLPPSFRPKNVRGFGSASGASSG